MKELKAQVIAHTPGLDGERIALETDTKEEAVNRLMTAFGNPYNGEWTDSLGQKFFVRVVVKEQGGGR